MKRDLVAWILAVVFFGLALYFLGQPPNRRRCDQVCNLSYCGCVETCPRERGR